MSRFDPYSRHALRRRRKAWLRTNVVVVSGVVLGIALMLAVLTAVLFISTRGVTRWYALGIFHAGTVAAGLHLLNTAFLAHDREALWHVRGAWGEENTRSELQRAKRRRLIWGWVDSISLQVGDLDHVVITRRGGLVALDSKWRNEVKANEPAQLARQALRAKTRAEALARTILRDGRGAKHRAKLQSLKVTPVVVLWGAAQHTVPDGAQIDGVTFIAGRKLVPWLKSLEGADVPEESARDALRRLKDYRATASPGSAQ